MNNLSRSLSIFCKRKTLNKFLPGICNVTSGETKFKGCKYTHSERSSSALLACLDSRGLIRLHGQDVADFLQGLVTNDVHEMMNKESSIQYSFMLNVQGRILYDLFLYNMTEKDGSSSTIFVDLPAVGVEDFMTLLKRYKLRRKVDISNISGEFKVWSQFSPHVEDCNSSPEISASETLISGPDPRVPDFGKRLIRSASNEAKTDVVNESIYRESRYKWGLPEGIDDLPPGKCFPLESNGVFMNAVSFEKGCYVGQELTARTHHTGVTRKRIMPLVFTSAPPDIEKDQNIKNEKGRNAGKFRGSQGSYGLGLVRLLHMEDNLSVITSDESQCSLQTHVPHWWPEFSVN